MKWVGKHNIFDDLMIGGVLLTPPDPATYSYELTLPNDDGSAGQVLTTDGSGVLTWTTITPGTGTVTSVDVSGGSTGLTTSGGAITSSGTITIGGTLAVGSGGTGQTTAQAAIDALTAVSGASANEVLIKDGSGNATWAATPGTTTLNGTTVNGLATYASANTLDIEPNLTWNGNDFLIESAVATKPLVEIKSTTNDNKGCELRFVADKGAAGVDGDTIAGIQWYGDNFAQTQLAFAALSARVETAAVNDAAGEVTLSVLRSNGSGGTGNSTVIKGTGQNDTTVDVEIANGATSTTAIAGELTLGVDLAVAHGGTGLSTVGTDEILTGNTTGALTSESDLRFYSDTLSIGSSSDSGTDNILRNAGGSDIDGGSLNIKAGDTRVGVANNRTGGNLNLYGGLSTGNAASGKVNFYTGWEGVAGTGQLGPALHTEIISNSGANYLTIYEPNLATADFFQVKVVAAGATTLFTHDHSGGQGGTIMLDADGIIDIDADRTGTIKFSDDGVQYGQLDAAGSLSNFSLFEAAGATTADLFRISVATAGATTISTIDAGGHSADLTLDADGDILIDSFDGIIEFERDGANIATIQDNGLGNDLTVFGTADGTGKIKLREDTDNGTNDITIQPPTAIASNRIVALPDADGTIAFEDKGYKQNVVLPQVSSYAFYLFYQDSWYSANGSTIRAWGNTTFGNYTLTGGNAEYAARMCSFVATSACTLKSLTFSFYSYYGTGATANLEFGFFKVPIVDGGTAAVNLLSIAITSSQNFTNTEYIQQQKTFTFTGANVELSAGQGFAFMCRSYVNNASTTTQLRGQIYGNSTLEIEYT